MSSPQINAELTQKAAAVNSARAGVRPMGVGIDTCRRSA